MTEVSGQEPTDETLKSFTEKSLSGLENNRSNFEFTLDREGILVSLPLLLSPLQPLHQVLDTYSNRE